MIVMETVLGVLLLTDRWTALGALLAFLLLMGNFGLLALALLRGMAVPNCGLFVVFLIQPLEPARIMEVLAVAGLTGGLYLLVRGEAVDISETEPGFSSWQISRSSSGTDSVSVLIRRTMLSVMQPLDGQKTRSAFYVYVRDLDDVHRRAI